MLDLKVIGSVFMMIFIAELGDKTQLATLAFSSGESSRFSVFIGSSLALILTSAIATLVGGALSQYVAPFFLNKIAGILFIIFGFMYIVKP